MPEIAVDGGARTARHAAQRFDVRNSLPRHQHEAHVRRPALQPHAQRVFRDHHQHRRGQLPHDGRRRRSGAGRAGVAVHQRGVRASRRAARPPDRTGRRVRDQPGPRGQLPLPGRAGAAGAPDLPRRRAEVHAADQAYDRRRLQGPSDRRDVQSHVGDDGPEHSPLRHAHRGDPHAVFGGPRAGARERALRDEHGPPLRRRDRPASRRCDRAPRRGGARAAARRCSTASPRWD